MFEDDLNPAENGNKSAEPGLGRWSVHNIYTRTKKVCFNLFRILLMKMSRLRVYIYCVVIFLIIFSSLFLSDIFEVYIYQKSQGNVYIYIYIYTHVILTCSSCMSKFVSICKIGKSIFEPV